MNMMKDYSLKIYLIILLIKNFSRFFLRLPENKNLLEALTGVIMRDQARRVYKSVSTDIF
jgi:hypothetical protein